MITLLWICLIVYIVIGVIVFAAVCSSKRNRKGEALLEALFWPFYVFFLIGD